MKEVNLIYLVVATVSLVLVMAKGTCVFDKIFVDHTATASSWEYYEEFKSENR